MCTLPRPPIGPRSLHLRGPLSEEVTEGHLLNSWGRRCRSRPGALWGLAMSALVQLQAPGMVGNGSAGGQRTVSAGWGRVAGLAGGKGSRDQTEIRPCSLPATMSHSSGKDTHAEQSQQVWGAVHCERAGWHPTHSQACSPEQEKG